MTHSNAENGHAGDSAFEGDAFEGDAFEGDAFEGDAFDIKTLDDERRREVITAYLDDELSPEAARHVTAWLDDHPERLREVEHLRRVWDLLELYEDEEVPQGFAAGVLRRVGVRPARGRLLRFPRAVTIAAVAALVLVALGLGIWLGRAPDTPADDGRDVATTPEAEAPIEIEYLEEVDVLLALSDDEFEAYLLADLEEPWEDG